MKTAAQLEQEVSDLMAEIKGKNTCIQSLETALIDLNNNRFGAS